MNFWRRTFAIVACAAASGCAGAGGSLTSTPLSNPGVSGSATTTTLEARSAQRALGPGADLNALNSSYRSAMGLSAIPAPLSAIPAPLSAIPAVGSGSPSAQSPFCATSAPAAPAGPAGPKGQPAPPAPPGSGQSGCHALVRADVVPQRSGTPISALQGLLPGWIQQIYNLPPLDFTSGANRTVAIVVAFDDPNAESDLQVYRNAFGLPACTSANGCFKKIAQDGSTNFPAADAGWSVETSTDLDTVSAVCPGCKLMLVEAASSNIPDLAAAVDTAAQQHADVISNSYGTPEAADNVQYESHYNHPGVSIVAAAGDHGYGVMFPASSPHVIAVGGTTLYQVQGQISEVAWPLTNAGCSAFFAKPSWQHDRGCTMRTTNDLAVVADPATGMAVYDSTLNGSGGGWTVVGGTSIGAPIVSAVIAMGKHPEHYFTAQHVYDHANQFNNITYGSDGICSVTYLCTATGGYSGPTGLGSPNGNQPFNS